MQMLTERLLVLMHPGYLPIEMGVMNLGAVDRALPHQSSGVSTSEENSKFFKHIRKIYQYLHKLEGQRSLDPKFSQSLEPLMKFFNSNCSETTSIQTSNLSVFNQTNARSQSPTLRDGAQADGH